MKKYILLAALLPAFFWNCQKNKVTFQDLSGDSTIRGTVVLFDTLTGPFAYYGVHPITVYLGYPTDTSGFLYSTVTNSLGQFSFNGIDQAQAYIVYASMDSAQLHFYGQISYPANQPGLYATDTLRLYPSQLNQNAILYQLLDSLGGALTGFRLFIFNSRPIWANDDSIGNTYALSSDAYGRCLQINVAPGKYWVHAKGVFRGLTLQGSDSITVGRQGISSAILKLMSAPAPFGNGILYYLQDSIGTPLSNCSLYVFNSKVLWGANDTTGNILVLRSDGNGKCIQQNIPPGEYYVHALGLFGNLTLQASDSISVVSQGITSATLKLLSAPAPYGNGLLYYLQDSLGGPLANCSLYVFDSQVLWNNSDSIGSIFKVQSDYTGKCLLQNIVPGAYYVHALGTFVGTTDTLKLAASGSIQVAYDSLSIQHLTLTKQ